LLPWYVASICAITKYSHFAIICRVTKIPHTCSCPHDLYFIISTHLSADWASDRKLEISVWTDRNYYSVSWVWNWGNVCSCWHWWLEEYPCWEISYLMSILFFSSSMTASICWGKCHSWPTWFEGHSTFVRNQLLIEVQGLGVFFGSIFFPQKSWIQFPVPVPNLVLVQFLLTITHNSNPPNQVLAQHWLFLLNPFTQVGPCICVCFVGAQWSLALCWSWVAT
jgi:hypothetical protein